MSGLLGSAPLGAVVPGSLNKPAQEKSPQQAGQVPVAGSGRVAPTASFYPAPGEVQENSTNAT